MTVSALMSLLVITSIAVLVLSRGFGWSPMGPQGFHPKRPIDPGDVTHAFDTDTTWSMAGAVRFGRIGTVGALHADATCVLLATRLYGCVAIDRREVTGVREIGTLNKFVHFDSRDGRFDALLFRVRRNGVVLDALVSQCWPVVGRVVRPVPAPAPIGASPAPGGVPLPPPPPPPPPPGLAGPPRAVQAIPRLPTLDGVQPAVRKVVSGLTSVALFAALVLLALTYADPPPAAGLIDFGSGLISIATVGLVGLTLLFLAFRQLGDGLRPASQLTTRVPFSRTRQRKGRAIGLLVLLFVMTVVVTTFMSRNGTPSRQGDRYYLTRDSVPEEVGAGTYQRAVAAQQRPVLAADILFLSLALLAWSAFAEPSARPDERGLPA